MDKKTTILSIRNQDERTVQHVYNSFRPKFENWLKGRYKIHNQEDCGEIYQRSFTVLFFNIKRGKLNDLEASLETYLFGIGKLVVLEWWRERKGKEIELDTDSTEGMDQLELFSQYFEANKLDDRLQTKLLNGLESLGEPCKTILKLYYWERNSMEAIALKTGYKNEQGAKKKKYLCLNKLRELMEET